MRVRESVADDELVRRLACVGRCRAHADGAGRPAQDALPLLFTELERRLGRWAQVATAAVMGWRSKAALYGEGITVHLMDRTLPRLDELELIIVPSGANRYLVRLFADNTLRVVVGTRAIATLLDRLIAGQLDAVIADKAVAQR